MSYEALFKFAIDQGASDIHLQAGSSPQLRIGGWIRNVEGAPVKAEELQAFIAALAPSSITDDLRGSLHRGAACSAAVAGLGRFRCTLYSQLGAPAIVLRVIPASIRTIEESNLPSVIKEIALSRRGLTLIVGPTASGKSATLATMIDLINGSLMEKIVTIEAPVEYLHANKKGLVAQLEVGRDTPSFEHGIARAMQQDADVILVSDLNDVATVRMALRAAEAGRQVLAAMGGSTTVATIERILALVSSDERKTATAQLAGSLEAIIAMRMPATKDGKRRPAVEVLRGGPLFAKALLANRLDDLAHYIAGRQSGMQSLDQHLIELYQTGAISGTETLRHAINTEAVASDLRGHRPAAGS